VLQGQLGGNFTLSRFADAASPPGRLTLTPGALPKRIRTSMRVSIVVIALRLLQPLSAVKTEAAGGHFKPGEQYSVVSLSTRLVPSHESPPAVRAVTVEGCGRACT
jgi:hypothetical protein